MSQTGTAARRSPWRGLGAVIAAAQGLALVANGAAVAWVVLAEGIRAPSAVASPVGIAVEVALYVLFGAGMLWIGHGIWHGSRAALTPFLLAQVLALTVAVPLASGSGVAALAGAALTIACVLGLVSWMTMVRGAVRAERRVPGAAEAGQRVPGAAEAGQRAVTGKRGATPS